MQRDALPLNALAGLCLLNLFVACMGLLYGFDSVIPGGWHGAAYRSGTIVLLALVVGAAGVSLGRAGNAVGSAATMRVLAAMCLTQLSLTLFFALPTRPAGLAIAVAWSGALVAGRLRGAAAAVQVAVAAGFVLFAGSLAVVPRSTPGADMLPFISHAIDVFTAGGDPYTADYTAIDGNPFFYPPVQWLIYLPLHVLGLDLRILNLASAAAIVILLEWRIRMHPTAACIRLGIYPILLCPLVLPMMHSGQVWPYWLAIVGFGVLALDRRWVWAAVVAALAVGLRPTALVPTLTGRVELAT